MSEVLGKRLETVKIAILVVLFEHLKKHCLCVEYQLIGGCKEGKPARTLREKRKNEVPHPVRHVFECQ
jgi:hypothetical protein